MTDYNKMVKLNYKLISSLYDIMDLLLFPKGRLNPRKGLAEQLSTKNIRVIDVCCGTGSSSMAIADKNPGSLVTGVDLSKDMLKVAEKKTQKRKINNIVFLEMNATAMNFPDEYFDAATISLALHEMPQYLMNSVLAEINRVLKPGGEFYIIDWEKPKSRFGSIMFSIFPSLFEPKVFQDFLKIDWELFLAKSGFKYYVTEHYSFTRLIKAAKLPVQP